MSQPGVRGCPSYGRPSLSGCSSCLPFASSFHVILLPGGLFYRSDLSTVELGDWLSGRMVRLFGGPSRSFRLFGQPIWSFWLLGRPSGSNYPLQAGRGGASCAFRPMFVLGWSLFHLVFPTAGYLTAVSFLVVRPILPPWGALVVVMGSRWPFPDGLPQLLVLTRRFPSKVLNAGCNNLHLSLNRGHGRIIVGPLMMVVTFHCFS